MGQAAVDYAGDGGISPENFGVIAGLLREMTGISLNANKRQMVAGRLARRVRLLGLDNFDAYVALLDSPAGAAEHRDMINALTTNLTRFFREPHHFTSLASMVVAPLVRQAPRPRLRIWSAACSSGEEAYSIAMVVHKFARDAPGWDARILATDIDSSMIDIATAGSYDSERAALIPPHFAGLVAPPQDGRVTMPDVLKSYIAFKHLNLLAPWPMRGKFDAIFCRNVVIYFDKDVQRILFDRLADYLTPQGVLFIGHSESLMHVSTRFALAGTTTYRKQA